MGVLLQPVSYLLSFWRVKNKLTNSRLKKREKVAIYENILKNTKNGIGTTIIIWIGYKQKVRESGLFHYLYLSDLPKLSKNFFTPSKNPEDFGACLLKSLPCKLSSSFWSNSFCSLVKLTGVSTTIRQIKSPA